MGLRTAAEYRCLIRKRLRLQVRIEDSWSFLRRQITLPFFFSFSLSRLPVVLQVREEKEASL